MKSMEPELGPVSSMEEQVMKSTEPELDPVSPMEENDVEKPLISYKVRPTDLYNFRSIENSSVGMFLL